MAISKETWNKAKAYFEAGKSLAFIVDKLKIGKSSISEKAKKDGWVKRKTEQLKDAVVELEAETRTLTDKKRTVTEQLASLEDYELEILSELVEDEAKIKSLIFGTTALNIIRVNEDLKSNMKLEKVSCGDGMQRLEPVKLGSGDYKNHQETLDKASITLGLNARHAPKTEIKNTNTNAQQTNIQVPEIEGYSVEVISQEDIDEAKRAYAEESDQ